jgi:hypothetical protein
MRQNISPRISLPAAKWLTDNFETLNAGGTYIMEAMPGLYRRTLHDLRGQFIRGELMLILDVMNGTVLTPGLAGQHLLANVRDGIDFDQLDQKWEIEGKALNEKWAAFPFFPWPAWRSGPRHSGSRRSTAILKNG